MTNDATTSILSALDIALFERHADGSFAALGAPPDWFVHLARDQTFPFLGTFLDEARGHWETAQTGRLRSGLCTEVDDQGREFHFEVSAIAASGRQFLAFERPAGAEHLQTVLQRARQQALDHQSRARGRTRLQATLVTLEQEAVEAHRLGRVLLGGSPQDAVVTQSGRESRQLTIDAGTAHERLISILDVLVETSRLAVRMLEQS